MAAFSRPHTAGMAVGALFGETFPSFSHIEKEMKWNELNKTHPLQELAYLSPQSWQEASLWSNRSLWRPVPSCGTLSSTCPQCSGLSWCSSEGRRRWQKYSVHTNTPECFEFVFIGNRSLADKERLQLKSNFMQIWQKPQFALSAVYYLHVFVVIQLSDNLKISIKFSGKLQNKSGSSNSHINVKMW